MADHKNFYKAKILPVMENVGTKAGNFVQKLAALRAKQIITITNLISKVKLSRTKLISLGIFFILLMAFLVRVGGINTGLPYLHHSDEPAIMGEALHMMKTGSFEPIDFRYPSLYKYMQLTTSIFHYFYLAGTGKITSLGEMGKHFDSNCGYTISHPSIYLWGRFLTVLLGTLMVYLTYKLASKVYGKKVGLLASLFLAFAFGHINHSRYITLDIPVSFFSILTVLYASQLLQSGKMKFYAAAGLFAGFTIATKYNFIIILPLLIAHIFNKNKDKLLNLNFLLMSGMVLVSFLIGNPYALLKLPRFLEGIGWELNFLRFAGVPGAEGIPGIAQLAHHLKYFYSNEGLGSILTILAIIGIFTGFKIKTRLHLLLSSFSIIYLIYISSIKVNFIRYTMPIMPFFAIFAAISFVMAIKFLSTKIRVLKRYENIIIIGLSIVLIFSPAKFAIEHVLAINNSKESRVQAVKWMKDNIAPGTKVAFVEELCWFKPDLMDTKFKVITIRPLEHSKQWYIQNGIDYIVTAKRFYANNNHQLAEKYNQFFTNTPVVKEFGLNQTPLPTLNVPIINPAITILKLTPEFDLLDIKDFKDINLEVLTMERRSKGPFHVYPEQKQVSYISYEDLLISPRLKLPRGKYAINVTASTGGPLLPTKVRSALTISLIKSGYKDKTIDTFALVEAEKNFATKEFEIQSDETFQLSFKKETLAVQTQMLQFDGFNDLVIIPFGINVDLPEGTLEFWEAPAFSSSEQTSSVSPLNFYTVEGHKFEFANGLLGEKPWLYSWFVWRRPDQYAIHINLFNPTFKADEWNHWAGTWKRSQDGNLHMEFYLNGNFAGRNTVPTDSVSSDSHSSIFFNRLEIGSMGDSWHFKGSIAEVRLFNKALKAYQLMQNPLKENSSFLVGYWKLLGTCNQIVPDLTQNHNDGTLGHNASADFDDPQCGQLEFPETNQKKIDWIKNIVIKRVD